MADLAQGDEYSDLSLKDLQANILQSHGRGHAWHLFLSLNGGQKQIRHWISWLANQITSAEGHNTAAEEWQEAKKIGKEKEIDEKVFLCFFLSAKGYERFIFSGGSIRVDRPFRLGMKRGEVNSLLKDPPSGKWEDNYKNRIDAMVLIANNSPEKLKRKKNEIEESLENGKAGKILFIEKGTKRVSRQGNTNAIEHFGYVDGISQPVFLSPDDRTLIRKNLPVVLVKEKNGRYGSYLVFRKLAQDVQAFGQNIKILAHELGVPADRAMAQVAGRFPDGTHLICFDSPQPKENWLKEEDVSFSDDPGGKKCPLHAHIRKINHRGSAGAAPIIQIARRGITYEGRPAGAEGQPEEKPGLLFMSYQASISGQFEILQGWANDKDFPEENTGIDPLIGQMITGEQQQQWKGANNKQTGFSFQDVVIMKGGEYFYAPSISYLKNLKFGRSAPFARGMSSGGRQGGPSHPYAQRMNLKGNLKLYGR